MIFISCLILYPIFVELLLYYYIICIIYLHIDDDSRNEQNLCHDSLHHNYTREYSCESFWNAKSRAVFVTLRDVYIKN